MATKPIRTQGKNLYAYMNDTPIRRKQSCDWSSNFTTESIFELGNAGIVQDSVSLVETAITINLFETGSIDPEAQFFNIYEQRNIYGNKTGIANTTGSIYVSSFGAGGDWSSVAVNSWLQVHRFNSSAISNTTEFVKVSSIRYNVASKCNIFGLDPLYSLTAAPATGDIVGLVNAYTITQDTVDANPIFLALPHRYSTTSTKIMHTIVLPRCYVDSYSLRVDTGGASEANFSLVGEEERAYLQNYRETRVIAGSYMAYNKLTGLLTFRVPLDSDASISGVPLAIYADSNLVETGGDMLHVASTATYQATFSGGLGIDSSSQIMLVYADTSPKGYKGITNITSAVGKITKGYTAIYFGTSTTDPEKLQRCTSIDISMPLGRESNEELGTSRSIGKPLEGNLRQEITLSFSRNDLREYAMMIDKSSNFDADDGSLNAVLMTSLKDVTTSKIIVYFYNSQTTHSASTLLKTITFENCSFLGSSNTSPVSGSAGLELKFSSQTVSIVGSGLPPIYS